MAIKVKFAFICTNYNNSAYTRAAVESLREGGSDCEIIVVDNQSSSRDLELVETICGEYSGVTLIKNTANEGYFAGLNRGISFLRETSPDTQYLLVGNNDLVFPREFEKQLISQRAVLNGYAVVSPDVITLDGVHQNPHVVKRISRIREIAYDLYYMNYGIAVLMKKMANAIGPILARSDQAAWQESGPVFMGHGSIFILGPKFFEHFKELWAPSFLMGEEFFLAKQLRERGQEIFYTPKIQVVHQCHASVGNMPARRMWEAGRDSHRVYRKLVRGR